MNSFEIFELEEEEEYARILENERRRSFYILTLFYNEVDSTKNVRKLRGRKNVDYVDNTAIPKNIFKGKRMKRRSTKNVRRCLSIKWSNRLLVTAGITSLNKYKEERTAKIQLAEKVVDTIARLRETLIHELCHAAAWIFDGHDAHGKPWKMWAEKVNHIFPELTPITQCHQYDIRYKYTYMCDGCGVTSGSHSKSLKDHICKSCGGRVVFISEIVNL
jgi:predicted SprT family Zn-dependent metalloprotease